MKTVCNTLGTQEEVDGASEAAWWTSYISTPGLPSGSLLSFFHA